MAKKFLPLKPKPKKHLRKWGDGMEQYDLKCGDIVVINEYGKTFEAIIIAHGTNNQPLIIRTEELERDCYRPFWSTYEAIIDNPYHIDITKILNKAYKKLAE